MLEFNLKSWNRGFKTRKTGQDFQQLISKRKVDNTKKINQFTVWTDYLNLQVQKGSYSHERSLRGSPIFSVLWSSHEFSAVRRHIFEKIFISILQYFPKKRLYTVFKTINLNDKATARLESWGIYLKCNFV